MPNSFDPNSRGASDGLLSVYGSAVVLVLAAAILLLLAISTGQLDHRVQVTAQLTNIGDGLPVRSDVKYRGMLVGAVSGVTPATQGKPNVVRIEIKATEAQHIPENVTARVVPSNVFAISSVELVEHGPGRSLRNGDTLAEDTALPTVLFQTTIDKLRGILLATTHDRTHHTVGLLETLATATRGRGTTLVVAGGQLNRLVDQLNSTVTTSTDTSDPSTVAALVSAARGLQTSAPALFDALHQAIKPMQTLAEKREQLSSLLSAGSTTLETIGTAFDNHTDQLITITTGLAPAVGVLAERREAVPKLTNMVKGLSDRIFEHGWDSNNMFEIKAVVSLTPSTLYTREDCPHYGDLLGPSCTTAPERKPGGVTPNLPPFATPDLPPQLLPNQYLAPGEAPAAVNSPTTAPASFGGSVGPVGSSTERDQLGIITGTPATASTQLLLGPIARGTIVTVSPPRAAP